MAQAAIQSREKFGAVAFIARGCALPAAISLDPIKWILRRA
jgi:hypothetical protein